MGSALETSRLAPLRGRSGNTAPRHAKLALRPICHASLRFYRSCAMGSALGRHASHACATGRLSRFTPARGRSITTPSQHVRPALCAERPRFAALLSSCAQGSALLIFFASACQMGVVTLSSIVRPVDNTSSRYADTSAAHFFRHSSLRFCLPARWISASAFAPFATPRCGRYPCPLVEIVAARRPGGLPSAPSLLRKTAPFFCHRQRSQLCPCGSGSGAVL